MRGFGCNNEEITAILPHRSANQRVNIEQVYKTLYGRDLMDDLKVKKKSPYFFVQVLFLIFWTNYFYLRVNWAETLSG